MMNPMHAAKPEQVSRVVIADENSASRSVAVRYFQKLGYEAIAVETAGEAMAILPRHEPALLVLNWLAR